MGPAGAPQAEPRPSERSHGAQIRLEAVTRRYRLDGAVSILAVDGVNLTIEPGTVAAVTGPSGSGKSTLLHLMGAMDRPDSGRVIIDGADITALGRRQLADYRRSVGFVFQRFNLLPALTVMDNVIAPVLPYRVGYDKRARAAELLESVGLDARRTALPAQLSGGQQQRVAIARALINEPRILFADEPTGNLDSQTGQQIIDLILAMRELHGITVVVATHNPGVARRADQTLRIRDGRLEE